MGEWNHHDDDSNNNNNNNQQPTNQQQQQQQQQPTTVGLPGSFPKLLAKVHHILSRGCENLMTAMDESSVNGSRNLKESTEPKKQLLLS